MFNRGDRLGYTGLIVVGIAVFTFPHFTLVMFDIALRLGFPEQLIREGMNSLAAFTAQLSGR